MNDGHDQVAAPPDLAEQVTELLAQYRANRSLLEARIQPLATSVDGRRFTFQASLEGLALETGQYVALEEHEHRLGQIHDIRVETVSAAQAGLGALGDMLIRLAVGTGVVLDAGRGSFHDVRIRAASQGEVRDWFARLPRDHAAVPIGELMLSSGVPAALNARGFGRHTFVCGQSGSGKTHALGVVLEGLLARTDLRIVIIDPNSDFVRLGEASQDVSAEVAAGYAPAAAEVSAWRRDPSTGSPLRLRLADVDAPARAAVLGLDPLRDREEYAALSELLEAQDGNHPLVGSIDELTSSSAPEVRQLGQRAANLGVADWSVWSRGEGRSLVAELEDPASRCLVVDVGSLHTPQEQRLVAETVLSTLWRNRARRQPCLIVIDEAHNVCPAAPADALGSLATSLAVQIAAEGRKFGLYLLTSSQRPQKVHPDVVSQCDNLLLMRMNSLSDLAFLRDIFSFVPGSLLERVVFFGLGQAVVAGPIVPHATYVRFGERISAEGGGDVPASWAAVR